MTIFGVPWEQLEPGHVVAYLSDPRNEGLTWEAKGTTIRPDDVRSDVCAFANSDLGGYLILGASQNKKTAAWTVDGWQPKNEPELWVEDCVGAGGVDPRPPFIVKAWRLDGDQWLAVVNVRPAAVPPCITSSGEVWQRVTGKSIRIMEAAALRHLFERGEAAQRRASTIAEAGRADLAGSPPEQRMQKVVLSMASPSSPEDTSATVFRESTYKRLQELLSGRLRADLPQFTNLGADLSQHALTCWSYSSFHPEEGYTIRLGRHGSVAIGRSDPDLDSGLLLVDYDVSVLRTMWDAAVDVLRLLGVDGKGHVAHVALRLHDDRQGASDLARWADVDNVTDEQLQSIQREAKRARGQVAWER